MKIVFTKTRCFLMGTCFLLFFSYSCHKAQEIPVEKMASIMYAMIKDNQITKETNPTVLEDAVIEPYAQKEGFTAADFKYTALMLEKDSKKNSELGLKIGSLLLEDLLQSLDTNRFRQMLEDIPDSHFQSSSNHVP